MFWLMRERDRQDLPHEPGAWPRSSPSSRRGIEADVIERSALSLLRQDYPGDFHLVLVDDNSDDGTDKIA